jgi:hypothetical protein
MPKSFFIRVACEKTRPLEILPIRLTNVGWVCNNRNVRKGIKKMAQEVWTKVLNKNEGFRILDVWLNAEGDPRGDKYKLYWGKNPIEHLSITREKAIEVLEREGDGDVLPIHSSREGEQK